MAATRSSSAALAQARRQGARTIYTVRAWGYDEPRFFEHADRVLTNSRISVQRHHDRLGLRADWLPSPLTWSEILAPEEARGFVTIVNPSPHKGATLFARLADMLGTAGPDIPLLVIQSEHNAADLAAIPRPEPGPARVHHGQPPPSPAPPTSSPSPASSSSPPSSPNPSAASPPKP